MSVYRMLQALTLKDRRPWHQGGNSKVVELDIFPILLGSLIWLNDVGISNIFLSPQAHPL